MSELSDMTDAYNDLLVQKVGLNRELATLRAQLAEARVKWRHYEQEYILPCFAWATSAGIDLCALVRDNPGHNCVDLLVSTLKARAEAAEAKLAALPAGLGAATKEKHP